MTLVSFIHWLVGKLGYVDKLRMDEKKQLDLHKLDRILQKYTSELPNSLQGVTFSVFNRNGPFFKSLSMQHTTSCVEPVDMLFDSDTDTNADPEL